MINLLRKFILDWLFVGDDQSPQQETLPAENIQEMERMTVKVYFN